MSTNLKTNTTPATRNAVKTIKEPKKSNSHARLKIIVRRLPPGLPEPVFWQSVQPWVSDETVSWKVFCPGKLRKDLGKENIPSVAYLLFRNEEHLATFSKEYDGHNFRDKQGNDSFAVVEFAPNPKAPPEKKKLDPRHATIQQDEDYLSFVASLQNPSEKHEVDVETLLASTVPHEETKITPLLAALLQQKEQKAVVQEKKILINDVKGSRKSAPVVASLTNNVVTAGSSSASRKGKKGKGKDSNALPPPSAAHPSGKGRSREGVQATSTSAVSSKEKQIIQPVSAEPPTKKEKERERDKDKDRERTRPVVGLGSRQLKAALSGAGVQLPTASSLASNVSASSPTFAVMPSPSGLTRSPTIASTSIIATTTTSHLTTDANPKSTTVGTELSLPHTGASARGRGEARGRKRSHEPKDGLKEGAGRGSGGGGGGGGRERKFQARPPSSGSHGPVPTADLPPPRILTRQDPVILAADPTSSEPFARSGGHQESGPGRGGGHRGRGGRRERGA